MSKVGKTYSSLFVAFVAFVLVEDFKPIVLNRIKLRLSEISQKLRSMINNNQEVTIKKYKHIFYQLIPNKSDQRNLLFDELLIFICVIEFYDILAASFSV